MEKEYKFMVWVSCMTYNHKSYIEDTMNGFCMQQTDFPYVCTIVDDASIDGEQEVIRHYINENFDLQEAIGSYEKDTDYGHVTFARHKTNMNCYFAVIYLKENHFRKKSKYPYIKEWIKTKYAAMCEGDDYWIDPLKLQKQVDILEADKTLMAVVANAKIVNAEGKELIAKQKDVVPDNKEGRYDLRSFMDNVHHYPTATVCYRRTHLTEISKMRKTMSNPYLGDWTLWIALHTFGDFYYIDEIMTAYRINPASVTHTVDRVDRAKANWSISASVVKVLPDKYADLKKGLKDPSWKWEELGLAYKAKKKYFRMGYCFAMCFLSRPGKAIRVFRKRWKNRHNSDYQKIKV